MTKQELFDYIAGQEEFLNKVSDSVWDNPETCYSEKISSEIFGPLSVTVTFHICS